MEAKRTDLVTGAFSFTGNYLTHRLLDAGVAVRTLTGHPENAGSLTDSVEIHPYAFEDHDRLVASFRGIHTFYNTYWVRFDYGQRSYENAVSNTKRLFRAAQEAGVERVVHVSIANPSEDSQLPYYRGKAELERDLAKSGLSYAIVRPAVLFGPGGILINNIAWLLRHFPVFAVMGRGEYRLQPVYVDDLASLMLDVGEQNENLVIDAVGPEVYTYAELVRQTRQLVGSRAALVHVPPGLGYWLARIMGWFVRDVIITRQEVVGLLDDLLISHEPPRCQTLLSEWMRANRDRLGSNYLSELALHYR